MSNIYLSKKIVIIGYMAAGKSTISQLLAHKLTIEAIDTDLFIENKLSISIDNIFEKHGELFFRKIENQIFKDLLIQNQSLIISTGGGLPCYFNNHELFQEPNIISIYLKYQPKNLAKRLISDKINRPIVAKIGEDELLEFVSKHLFERNQYYMQAEHIISCDDKTIDEIVEECLTIIHTS